MSKDWNEADQFLKDFKNDISSMIENDFNEAGCVTEYRSTIHHYTDVKSTLSILQTGQMWFTERAHLNDPTEVQYGLSVGRELFESSAATRGTKIPTNAALHLHGEHGFGLSYFGFWSASFSFDDDELGQWRSYADDGRGVCLGFAAEKFDMIEIAKLLPRNPNSLRYPVCYDKDILERRLRPYVERSLDILERADIGSQGSYITPYGRALLYERDLLCVLNDGFYANALLSKHPAFKSEQEYRLLISGVRDTITRCDLHHVRVRRGEIVGYMKVPIPSWKEPGVLTHLRIGPAAPDELMDQLRVTFTGLGIPQPKIGRSSIPYRSTR